MNGDTRAIAARLQAAIVRIDRHLDILWHASRLHAAAGKAEREPSSAAGAGLPLQGQRPLVANRKRIRHLLSRRELAESEIRRIHNQLRLLGGH